ncbi:MAG: hypothetical protein F6J93_03540 [Oscillatoria sp. SIO1A7]|nr:hypothetical protein [Oscillatoria sp. SIO1A7]
MKATRLEKARESFDEARDLLKGARREFVNAGRALLGIPRVMHIDVGKSGFSDWSRYVSKKISRLVDEGWFDED